MRVAYHAEFARDINRFAAQYGDISGRLQERFRVEVDLAIARIQEANAEGKKIRVPLSAEIFLTSSFCHCLGRIKTRQVKPRLLGSQEAFARGRSIWDR